MGLQGGASLASEYDHPARAKYSEALEPAKRDGHEEWGCVALQRRISPLLTRLSGSGLARSAAGIGDLAASTSR